MNLVDIRKEILYPQIQGVTHGRREVRAATIARDILRSATIRAARVTTSIYACVVDDVLQRLPPLIRVVF
jgi:hypothetical protein